MKYSLFIVFLLVGLSQSFLGPVGNIVNNVGNTVGSGVNQAGQTAENALNDIKAHVEKAINQIIEAVNGIKFAANFLWDNVFSPALDMMLEGGQFFLNDKFGGLANIIGQPIAVPENPLSEKYGQLIARFKSNIHHLYEHLFMMEKDALAAVGKGEGNFEEKIRAFYDKIEAIKEQIQQWATETKIELETHANTIEGDWNSIVNQYKQNIDGTVNAITTMFQQLTQNLLKNFVDVIPNAANLIEKMKAQGFLSFFKQ